MVTKSSKDTSKSGKGKASSSKAKHQVDDTSATDKSSSEEIPPYVSTKDGTLPDTYMKGVGKRASKEAPIAEEEGAEPPKAEEAKKGAATEEEKPEEKVLAEDDGGSYVPELIKHGAEGKVIAGFETAPIAAKVIGEEREMGIALKGEPAPSPVPPSPPSPPDVVPPPNRPPRVGSASEAVSDEGLPGGIKDTTGVPSDTTDLSTVGGVITVVDSDGFITSVVLTPPLAGMTSGGAVVTWEGSGTNMLTAKANGVDVATLQIDNSGHFTFTLLEPVDHPLPNIEDIISLGFGVTATDNKGASATGTLNISIEDDMPVIEGLALGSSVSLDETAAGEAFVGGPISATSVAPIISATYLFGADNAAAANAIVYSLDVIGGGATPLMTSTGDYAITLVATAPDTVEGQYYDTIAMMTKTAFEVKIESDGKLTVTQYAALEHLDPNVPNDVLDLTNLINGRVTITDADGDKDTGAVAIGGAVTFYDDGPQIQGLALGSAVSLDETAAGEAFVGGPISATSVAPIISATYLFGADNAAAANAIVYSLDVIGGGATPLMTSTGDYAITLVATAPDTVEGQYYDTIAMMTKTAFEVKIESDGKLTVTQYAALEHLNPLDPNDVLDLTNLINGRVTITDADGDKDTGAVAIGGAVTFYDDGPQIQGLALGSAVSLDETAAGEAFVGGPISATSAASIISATYLFGADNAAAASAIVYELDIIGGGATTLKTSTGDYAITLIATAPDTVEGQYYDTIAMMTKTAFEVKIESDGKLTVTQYAALEHLNPLDPNDVLDLTNLINGRVTITDADGDKDTGAVAIGGAVTFYDDGPQIQGLALGSAVSLDETAAGEAFVGGPISATSAASIISATYLFGADDAAAANAIVYELDIIGGGATTLKTSTGDYAITLVATAPDTVEGQYYDTIAMMTKTAFEVKIESDGKLTVTQYAALEHLNPLDPNDVLDLTNLINGRVTITDADGDKDTGAVAIGGAVTFYDDGPQIQGLALGSAVSLDETAAGEAFVGGPISATSAASIISATYLFGADNAAAASAIVYELDIIGGGATTLKTSTGDYAITLIATAPDTVEGQYYDTIAMMTKTAFEVKIESDGKLTVTQYAALEHLNPLDPNDVLDLTNLINGRVTITDADGDKDTGAVAIGGAVTFYDDGPQIQGLALGSAVSLDETAAGEAFVGGPISATSAASIISATYLFGADDAAAANAIVYELDIIGGGATTLKTSTGDYAITLVATAPDTVEGQYYDTIAMMTKTAFEVKIESDGKLTVTQYAALEHLNPLDPNDVLDLTNLINGRVTITDADGDKDTGAVAIGGAVTFYDDGPTILAPEHLYLYNPEFPDAVSGTEALNFTAGADGVGDVIFTEAVSTGGSLVQALDSNGGAIYYNEQPVYLFYDVSGGGTDHSILEGWTVTDLGVPDALAFSITLNEGTALYTFNTGALSNLSEIQTEDLSGLGGGNVGWKALIGELDPPLGVTDFALLGTNDDVMLSTVAGETVNTNANDIGISGGNSFTTGEIVQMDFVDNLAPAKVGADWVYSWDGSVNSINHFEQYVSDVQGAQSNTANLMVTALVADSDLAMADDYSGYPNIDPGNGDPYIVPLDAGNIKVFDALNNDVTGSVTFNDLGDSVIVNGIQQGWYFTIDSETPFTALQVEAAPDAPGFDATEFKLGSFSYSYTVAGDPIPLDYDIRGFDADGDFIDGSVAMTLYPQGYENVYLGSDIGDNLAGTSADDFIAGNAGADTLIGDDGGDILFGGSGDDTLIGGAGDDTLRGGTDSDTLTGGGGQNTFVWHYGEHGILPSFDTDVVTDFKLGGAEKDVINLHGLLLNISDTDLNNETVLSNYISVTVDSGNDKTIISVDPQGNDPVNDSTLKIELAGVGDSEWASVGVADTSTATSADLIKELIDQNQLRVENDG